MTGKRRDYRVLLVGGFLLLSLGVDVYTQDCVDGVTIETQEITGKVNALRPDFLSVVYDQKGNSLYTFSFLIDEATEIEGKPYIIDNLDRGDRIRVEYDQTTECRAGKNRLKQRTAKKIKLITQEVDFQSVKEQKD